MGSLSRHRQERTPKQSYSELETLVLERTAALQMLSQTVLRVQDDERRKVARDLHDSTGQTLAALKISVAVLQGKLANDRRMDSDIATIALLADSALQEIRTTSYLLHPPLLDEAGFASAARWYVEGFSKRSGMKVFTDIDSASRRLPGPVEMVLFRVLQESLTNVHRHSGTPKVDVSLRYDAATVVLQIRDYGCGVPKRLTTTLGFPLRDCGVGLAGMCERLNELKGRLDIALARPGTRLRAIVPISAGE
jgi:two-component system, NarL family, sensor kinase